MKDPNCGYCMEGEVLGAYGIKICDLETSMVVLFKEQSHRGRLIVAYKEHVGDITLLTDEQRNAYFADVAKVAKAMHKVFSPDKINYGAYGDTGSHIHFHLVPKYKDDFEWGSTFAMNPAQKYLSDDEYAEMAELIKKNL